ncbi:MAG: hypothetical protein LBU95_03685, partial [Rikenellaceae bacterium]|nr:hypothetical protein [Rikenellaceae bacterium]
MKKVIIALAAAAVVAIPASAQFGKALKDIGRSVQTAATETASDAVADNVAKKISAWLDSHNRVVASDRLTAAAAAFTAV